VNGERGFRNPGDLGDMTKEKPFSATFKLGDFTHSLPAP